MRPIRAAGPRRARQGALSFAVFVPWTTTMSVPALASVNGVTVTLKRVSSQAIDAGKRVSAPL